MCSSRSGLWAGEAMQDLIEAGRYTGARHGIRLCRRPSGRVLSNVDPIAETHLRMACPSLLG